MPPKPMIRKQDILKTAVQMVRKDGMGCVNARSLASALKCSTKPLFRLYKSMEELKADLIAQLNIYYNLFMDSRTSEENRLVSRGIAYVEFAQKERMIFRALFMEESSRHSSLRDILEADGNHETIQNVQTVTGLPPEKAEEIFIKLWFYAQGIAVRIAADDTAIPAEMPAALLTDAFKRFSMEIF